jgi:hypothetical protein
MKKKRKEKEKKRKSTATELVWPIVQNLPDLGARGQHIGFLKTIGLLTKL